jgi:hypothetical protein
MHVLMLTILGLGTVSGLARLMRRILREMQDANNIPSLF